MIEFKDNINVMFLYYNHFWAHEYPSLDARSAFPLQKYYFFRYFTNRNGKKKHIICLGEDVLANQRHLTIRVADGHRGHPSKAYDVYQNVLQMVV